MKRIAVISPHLDDGVLSCGDYIVKNINRGNEVTIITVFTGYPDSNELSSAAKQYHSNCFLSDDSMKYRRQEDIRACNRLGCKFLHLGLYECLYRKNRYNQNIYPNLDRIYYWNPDDDLVINETIKILERVLEEYDIVLAPLGLGNHADHIVVNKAVSKVAFQHTASIFYYEEIPYLCYMLERNEKVIANDMTSVIVPISHEEWLQKVDAIMSYRSQLHIMWKNLNDMRNQLNKAATTYFPGGLSIRLWEKKNENNV